MIILGDFKSELLFSYFYDSAKWLVGDHLLFPLPPHVVIISSLLALLIGGS